MKRKRLWIIAGLSLAVAAVIFVAYLAYAFQAGPVEGRPTLMYFHADL